MTVAPASLKLSAGTSDAKFVVTPPRHKEQTGTVTVTVRGGESPRSGIDSREDSHNRFSDRAISAE